MCSTLPWLIALRNNFVIVAYFCCQMDKKTRIELDVGLCCCLAERMRLACLSNSYFWVILQRQINVINHSLKALLSRGTNQLSVRESVILWTQKNGTNVNNIYHTYQTNITSLAYWALWGFFSLGKEPTYPGQCTVRWWIPCHQSAMVSDCIRSYWCPMTSIFPLIALLVKLDTEDTGIKYCHFSLPRDGQDVVIFPVWESLSDPNVSFLTYSVLTRMVVTSVPYLIFPELLLVLNLAYNPYVTNPNNER